MDNTVECDLVGAIALRKMLNVSPFFKFHSNLTSNVFAGQNGDGAPSLGQNKSNSTLIAPIRVEYTRNVETA